MFQNVLWSFETVWNVAMERTTMAISGLLNYLTSSRLVGGWEMSHRKFWHSTFSAIEGGIIEHVDSRPWVLRPPLLPAKKGRKMQLVFEDKWSSNCPFYYIIIKISVLLNKSRNCCNSCTIFAGSSTEITGTSHPSLSSVSSALIKIGRYHHSSLPHSRASLPNCSYQSDSAKSTWLVAKL